MIDIRGAIDLHVHTAPCLFPRLADDVTAAAHARDRGLAAIVLKSHHESTASRAYLTEKAVPGIRVLGGIVLNLPVGGINPGAVAAALATGGVQVWMPTIDAAHHAAVYGHTGGYRVKRGGRETGPAISLLDEAGRLRPEVLDVIDLVADHGAILGTGHISPKEIAALVPEAFRRGVEKILLTHPLFTVPALDLETVAELVRLGAYAEFTYCSVSPMWSANTMAQTAAAVKRLGASRCVLTSDAGQRHNPYPAEALRIFAQGLFELGTPETDVYRMIRDNPRELLGISEQPPPAGPHSPSGDGSC